MKSSGFPFYLQTVLVAAGLYWLLTFVVPRPSSQLTFLLVLISVGLLKLLTFGRRRLRRLLLQQQTYTLKKTLVKEKEMNHENKHS